MQLLVSARFVLSTCLVTLPASAQAAYLTRDIAPGTASNLQRYFQAVNGVMFFDASDGVNGIELWRSEGTQASTLMVRNINDGGFGFGHSSPDELTNWNGSLYFVAFDGALGDELWRSDGTEAGTVLVADLGNGFVPGPAYLTPSGGVLFFAASGPGTGVELWKSDGTQSGTVLVADLAPGLEGSEPRDLVDLGGTLYFSALQSDVRQLWKSDGTAAGTLLVDPLGTAEDPENLESFAGTLFFTASDGIHGRELWKSDGLAAGTALVRDLQPGAGSSNPTSFTPFGDRLFFTAFTATSGRELWKTDGTETGTVLVKDIYPGSVNSEANDLVVVKGVLYLAAVSPSLGQELWKSDGSVAGTVIVEDIRPGSGSGLGAGSFFSYLTNARGTLFFAADDGVNGTELWRSDGTAAGTELVQDIRPGPQGALAHQRPYGIRVTRDRLFFLADDGSHGLELWALDLPDHAPFARTR